MFVFSEYIKISRKYGSWPFPLCSVATGVCESKCYLFAHLVQPHTACYCHILLLPWWTLFGLQQVQRCKVFCFFSVHDFPLWFYVLIYRGMHRFTYSFLQAYDSSRCLCVHAHPLVDVTVRSIRVFLGASVVWDQALRWMWEESAVTHRDGGRKRSLSSLFSVSWTL